MMKTGIIAQFTVGIFRKQKPSVGTSSNQVLVDTWRDIRPCPGPDFDPVYGLWDLFKLMHLFKIKVGNIFRER